MAANVLVSYNNITAPFPDLQTLLGKTRDAAGQTTADPAKADARVASIAAALQAMQKAQGKYPKVMHTPRDQMGSLLQSHIARQAAQNNKLDQFLLKGISFIFEGFEVKFSQADWFEWMLSFFTWIDDIVPANFLAAPDEPEPIRNNFRMAVIGDWGTHLYGAPHVADSVKNDPQGWDLLLHLGDTYYSGLPEEMTERFLPPIWPSLPNVTSRYLNGNHEMYSGGHAYFEQVLPSPAFQQKASYFALQNDYWTLVGLDTAYDQPFGGQTGDLGQNQIDWLRKIIQGAENRKVVLFTHHEPYSLFEVAGTALTDKLGEFLTAGKIFAWYWGHEHRCLLYDVHETYKCFGRCVGHGGFPQERPDLSTAPRTPDSDQWRILSKTDSSPGARIVDSANVYISRFEAQFAPNGFMRLEFEDDRLIEYVRAPDGANIYLQDLPMTAKAGG
jgi:hypothetical protein